VKDPELCFASSIGDGSEKLSDPSSHLQQVLEDEKEKRRDEKR